MCSDVVVKGSVGALLSGSEVTGDGGLDGALDGVGDGGLDGAVVVDVVVIMKAGANASQMRSSRHAQESTLSARRLRWLPSTWLLAASMSATSSLDPCG